MENVPKATLAVAHSFLIIGVVIMYGVPGVARTEYVICYPWRIIEGRML